MMSMNAPVTPADDPWDWSVDQVVNEFCRVGEDRPAWCSSKDRLPDPTVLEQALRENDVTGEIMLIAITKDVLRDDLGIKSMGQRHAVGKGIDYLRLRSQKFQTSPANPTVAPPFTPVQSWLQASGPPYDPVSNIDGSVKSVVPPGQTFGSPRLEAHVNTIESLHSHSRNIRQPRQLVAPSPLPKETSDNENCRNATVGTEPFKIVDQPAIASTQGKSGVKVPRRIAPTFVRHLVEKSGHSAQQYGEDVGFAKQDGLDREESDEREFEYISTDVAGEEQISASRRIKKYLASLSKAALRSPHPSESLPIQDNNDATDRNLQESLRDQNEHDEFQFLLARYPPQPDTEDALALYGDSGDEGYFDAETWHEIEKDAAEDRENQYSKGALSLQEVNATIDEFIEEFKLLWRETKLAKVQAKGFRLWKNAQREGRVQNEIATAQYWIQHLQQSIVKIRQAIARESWANVRALRQQCQSLEESIFQQQEYQYNITILTRTTAPPRPTRNSVRRENPRPLDLADEDIFLESESDVSMSNFLDDGATQDTSTEPQRVPIEETFPVHASEDSDDVLSPMAKRHRTKPVAAHVDPRKNPFSQSSPSGKASSAAEDSDLDLPAPLPQSKYEKVGHEKNMPIDLVSSSDPTTPTKYGVSKGTNVQSDDNGVDQSLSPRRLKLHGPKPPELDDIEGINEMAWEEVENKSDWCRALAKAVYSLKAKTAVQVQAFVQAYDDEALRKVVHQGFIAILDKATHVEGVACSEWHTARITALLSASYSLARKVVDESPLDRNRMLKAKSLVDKGYARFSAALKDLLNNYLKAQSVRAGKRKSSDAASRDVSTGASDTESASREPTSARKRRRRIKESQMAMSSQLAGQQRVQEQEHRRAIMAQKFQNIPRNKMDPASHAIGVIEPFVYLDPKIGAKIKAHQINGIQFMWRELTTDKNQQGCLLAHTMGLGKTMQVISLLVTIAQAVRSPDARIREQVPRDLQDMRALILCPPSLIDNWYEEILMWRPEQTVLGGLYKITQKTRKPDRVQDIAHWASTAGILIISYEMFRNMIVNKAGKRNIDDRPFNDADHAAVQEHLLNHPNIIIADEAHKMKNAEAGISTVTSRFRSTRRIALTGSPLANNLDEYFAMIDWIAPGYLGTKEQFRSKYANPIADGLWNDSEQRDRRTSLRRLHVLKKNLEPKVSRADITAIADDLPPKAEFFITVPLTKLQVKAYNQYITTLLGSDAATASGTARLWDWLAILSLLCNHPSTFLNKIDERQYGPGSKAQKLKARPDATTDDVEGAGLPADVELTNTGLSAQAVELQHKIFQGVEDSDRLEDPNLSHRSQIVCDIVEFSIAAGDKVLLFSHSIPTLNYLESTISALGHSTCRLDGSTNVTLRQEAVKNFNKETATYNVFFISTKAGGLGLNLQGANRVILFDYGFNPIWEEQAVGRAYRLGQQKTVFVYRLRAGGTFEELIYNKAVFKTQLAARVVDKKNPMRYASRKVTDYLFHVKDVPQEDLTSYYGKDPEVLDRVLRNSNCIRDITLTETFQKEEDESLTPEEAKQADEELKNEQERRRDPREYEKKLAELQANLLNTRPNAPTTTAAHPSPYGHAITHRPPASVRPQHQQSALPSITPNQQISYVSRPEAIRGPQQAEGAMWDHRSPPHLHDQVQNVLGAVPWRNITPTSYPSPTAATRPKEVKKFPGSPNQLGRQIDGTVDNMDEEMDAMQLRNAAVSGSEDSDADIAQCKAQ